MEVMVYNKNKMGKKSDIRPSEITPKELYMNRRQFIAGTTAAIAGLGSFELLLPSGADSGQRLKVERRSQYTLQEEQTAYKYATGYNNFYEFSTEKEDVAALSRNGFFANVNPDVPHPRWSQARERRLGEFFKRKTLMFNGYADQVAHLYTGMDLRRFF